MPATTDTAVLVSCSTAIVAWAALLKQVLAAIAIYDEKIDALGRAHPDYALMNSFLGDGPALTPRLIAAMGSKRDRYQPAHEVQCYSGVAPVLSSAQVLPEWTTLASPCKNLSANGDYP